MERGWLNEGGDGLNDFDLICHQFLGGHDVTIIPIADVHLGAKECNDDAFRRFVQSVAETPNVYVILGGDLINNSTRSSVGSPFDEVIPPHIQKREMAKILEPIRDRILCAVSGNHERRSKKDADDDATYDILCKIDKETIYREDIAFLKIQMGVPQIGDTKTNGAQRPTYRIIVTHGNGGGYLPGAAVNRGQRYGYVFDGMDLLVLGHTHMSNISKYKKIRIDAQNNRVTTDDFKVLISTAWLEYGGYAVQKMLYPAAFAEQSVILSGRGKRITVQIT